MRILVWQWGRLGAGPRIAADYVTAFNAVPGVTALLMRSANPPACAIPVRTYQDVAGYLACVAAAPILVRRIGDALRTLAPDFALCAMPGPLDLAMQFALQRAGIPAAIIVHDADAHPGDGYPLQMMLQRLLVRRADAVVTLSDHVTERLGTQGLLAGKTLIRAMLPQPPLGELPPPLGHGGPFRLLSFGRLLAYKGLDLLAGALARVQPDTTMVVRVVGQGPESPELAALRCIPRVTVENRWVPEDEIPALLGWADGVVLSHREASQSGVAATALAARRFVVATRVGGLAEQVAGDPAAILCDVSVDGLTRGLRTMLAAQWPDAVTVRNQWQAENLVASLRKIGKPASASVGIAADKSVEHSV
jgi:glycosyltransferase involved in cell wall biosynthesis